MCNLYQLVANGTGTAQWSFRQNVNWNQKRLQNLQTKLWFWSLTSLKARLCKTLQLDICLVSARKQMHSSLSLSRISQTVKRTKLAWLGHAAHHLRTIPLKSHVMFKNPHQINQSNLTHHVDQLVLDTNATYNPNKTFWSTEFLLPKIQRSHFAWREVRHIYVIKRSRRPSWQQLRVRVLSIQRCVTFKTFLAAFFSWTASKSKSLGDGMTWDDWGWLRQRLPSMIHLFHCLLETQKWTLSEGGRLITTCYHKPSQPWEQQWMQPWRLPIFASRLPSQNPQARSGHHLKAGWSWKWSTAITAIRWSHVEPCLSSVPDTSETGICTHSWFVPVDWCIKWHNSSHSSRSFGSILSNGMSNLAPAISSKLGDYEQLTGNDRGKFTQLAYLLRLKATRAESLWNPTASLQRLQSLNLPSCPVPSRCR